MNEPFPPAPLLLYLDALRERAMAAESIDALAFTMANDLHAVQPFRQALVFADRGRHCELVCASGLASPAEDSPYLVWLGRASAWLAAQLAGRRDARARAMQLLDELGLKMRANHRPAALSGGEQQRVGIAIALGNEPSLILADEPTGNLDSQSASSVMELLKKIGREGATTLIVVTHSDEVATAASRRVEMRDGRIAGDSPT